MLAACRGAAPPPTPHALAIGAYRAYLPAADAADRAITLELRADGEALLTTLHADRREAIVERGAWSADQAGIRVQLASQDGVAPAALVFALRGLRLEPAAWDESRYGRLGLPLLRWRPSRPPAAGCAWTAHTDAARGLRLLVQECPPPAPPIDVAAAIEVVEKPADEPIEAAIASRFAAALPEPSRDACAVRPARGVQLGDPTKRVYQLAPKTRHPEAPHPRLAALDCGDHGARDDAVAYFEVHPVESRTRFLFVRPVPGIDERSIELLW